METDPKKIIDVEWALANAREELAQAAVDTGKYDAVGYLEKYMDDATWAKEWEKC